MSGRYYRRRYNNWYRGGRYYGRNRRYYRSSTVRRAAGNMRAAKQQADQSTFTINIPSTIEAANYPSANPFAPNNTVNYGVYPLNIFEQLRKSEFYQSYAGMYDEFKIDRIKIKLLPTEFTYTATAGANNDGGRYRNITVYTAWDRTGLSKDQLILIASHLNEDSTEIGVVTTNQNVVTDDGDGLFCIVGNDITTYSSAESRVINPGTNTSIVRWLNPKTIDEKGQWVSTGALKQWYKGYREGKFYGIPTGKKENFLLTNYGDIEIGTEVIPPDPDVEGDGAIARSALKVVSSANKDNPCYLLEDTGIKFKPTLLVGIYPESTNTNTCKFNVETEVVCTFRGLRKANVVAA
jgi:hypothetical protein